MSKYILPSYLAVVLNKRRQLGKLYSVTIWEGFVGNKVICVHWRRPDYTKCAQIKHPCFLVGTIKTAPWASWLNMSPTSQSTHRTHTPVFRTKQNIHTALWAQCVLSGIPVCALFMRCEVGNRYDYIFVISLNVFTLNSTCIVKCR